MSTLNHCCNQWKEKTCQPISRLSGRFNEIQSCDTCKQKFSITFEQITLLGKTNDDFLIIRFDKIK